MIYFFILIIFSFDFNKISFILNKIVYIFFFWFYFRYEWKEMKLKGWD
jgi:hypothetical protein